LKGDSKMPFTFTTKASAPAAKPTFSDVPDGGFFQTNFGTVYVRVGSQVVKLGNPKNAAHNQVAVKPASYFDGDSRPVTLLSDPTISL
jgi:hypothetical protein